jgi:hypothetical protein
LDNIPEILLRGYPSVTMNILKSGRKNRENCFSKFKLNAFALYIGFIFCMAYASSLKAQTNTTFYQFLPDTAGFLSLDRNGNSVSFSNQADIISPSSQQVNSSVISLPFEVFFMGSSYTHFLVNVNGCVVMAPSAAISFTPSLVNNYTGVTSQYAVFAPFWDVLKTSANKGIKYTVSGVAPYRSLTVEWYALPGSSSVSSDFDMQFQFRLYESTNIIEYVYGKMQIGTNITTPITASIGFSTVTASRDSSFISVMNTDSLYVSRLRTDLTASQNLVNTRTPGVIKGLHNIKEGQRTRIAFVPYPMLAPGNLTAFNITSNEALLYWDDYTTDEFGFKTYKVNKANEPEFDTTLAPNITFRNLYGLLPGTTYQYRVQGYNNYTSAYSNIVSFRTSEADTLHAVKSGNWNDTATWGGFVPNKNTVVEIPASFTVKLNINEARCHQLLVNGELTFADQATTQKLYVNYDVINYGIISASPSPTYNNTGNEIIVGRNVVNMNILNLFKPSASYTNAVNLRFIGKDHSRLTGNGDTTNIYSLISDKDSAKDSLTVNPLKLTVKGAATDQESNGPLLNASATHTGILLIGGSFMLENRVFPNRDLISTKGFSVVIDNPQFKVAPLAGDFTINGSCLLKLKKGTIAIQGSLQLRALASLIVEGGELTISNQLKNFNNASDAFFTQSGGRIITAGLVFNSAKNNINLIDGVLISDGNAQLLADMSVSKFGTHKVLFESPANPAFKQYSVNGNYAGIFIDSITNTSSVIELILDGNTTVNNKLFIGSNDTLEIGAYQLTINADSTVIDGSLQSTNVASKIILASSNSQVISGNGIVKVNTLEISKEDTFTTTTFNISNPVLINNAGFYGGNIIRADKLKIGNNISSSIVKIGRTNGTGYGSYLDSSPVYVDLQRLNIEYNTEYAQRTTGYEIPQSRKFSGLFFANTSGVKIQGGNIEVTDTLALLSGKIVSSVNNQIILSDTTNPQSIKIISGSYFTGPFTRSIPAKPLSEGKVYEFPIGTEGYVNPLTFYNPNVNGKTINIQVSYSEATVKGTTASTLKNLRDTGFWQLAVLNNNGNLTGFTINVHDDELTSRSKLALAKSSSATLTTGDVFYPAGERITYLIDSLKSDTITVSAIDSFYYFTKAELVPDTLSVPVYTIGDGEDFENITAVAKRLSRSYIDSTATFEITKNYSSDKEVFPIAFEQMLYTNSENSKLVTIKLAKNVTGIVTANTKDFTANALLNFYGADSLTLNGMGYDALGMATGQNEWTVKTTSAGVPVIRFVNDASYNKLSSLNVTANNNTTTSGTIVLGGIASEKSGNDFNTIENNIITSSSTTLLSANHIISVGASGSITNDNNTILNNRISNFSTAGINITPTGNGSGWLLEGNTIFQTYTSTIASTSINFVPGLKSGNNNIRLNLIGGIPSGSLWNYSGTTTLSALVIDVDTATETMVSDNSIKGYNISNSGTANGLMAITVNNGRVNIIANKIGGPETSGKITIAGRGLSALIRSLTNGGQVTISDNIITNINQSVAAGTTNKVRAISVEGFASVNIVNNSISNITGLGASIDYRDASVTGIYISGATQNASITSNKIYNLDIASTATGYVTGISINGVANGNISANNLYNLTNASTTAGRFITGISVEYGSWLISNNKIAISNSGNETKSAVIQALRVSAPSPYKNKVLHNTVFVGGITNGTAITTAGSYSYYQSGTNADVQVMNNLFVNTRGASSIHPAAYWVISPNTVSNFNHYYGRGTATMISTSGTLRSFLSFQSLSGGDKNSTSDIIPAFENIPENITTKDTSFNCFIKGSGSAVANVETDYTGKLRHTTQPDLGADEFVYSPSLPQAPVLTRGNDTLCAGLPRILFVNQPNAGGDIQWFDAPAGGNLLFTGFDFATGKITTDTVFYAQVSSGLCKSYRTEIKVKVKPGADVQLVSAPSDPICGGNSITLQTTANVGNSVNWFADSISIIPIANGNNFTTGILFSDTTFFVEASNGICPSIRKKVTIAIDNNINLLPPVIDTLLTVCKGDSLTLKAISNYDVAWYANISGAAIATDSILVLDSVIKDTFYYVAATNGSCLSSFVKVQVKVNNKPLLPVVDSIMNVCGNQPFLVSLTINEGNINWFTDSIEPVYFYSGTQLSLPDLFTDSTFYFEVTNGNCPATIRVPVTLKPTLVNAPVVDPVSAVCKNTAIQLSVNNRSTNGTVKWYASLTDNVPVYTGNPFTTSALHNDTQYYVQQNENTCASERVMITVPVVESVESPLLISADSICKGSLSTISVSSVLPVSWYADAVSNDVISTDYFFTAGILSNDSVFYVAAQNGNCYSPRLSVKVNVKPAPQPPLFTPVSNLCAGTSVVLNVSATDSVKWYATVNSTTPINRGNTFITPKLNATTTYYLETDNGACKSKRVALPLTVLSALQAPVVTETYRTCFNEGITLKANATSTINWYASAMSNIVLQRDSVFTTEQLKSDTTFYTESFDGYCRSPRVAVPVSVLNYLGNMRVILPDSAILNEPVNISSDGLQSSVYSWEFGSGASLSGATGQGPFNVSYATAGEKTIKVTVSRRSGNLTCDTVIVKYFNVVDTTIHTGLSVVKNQLNLFKVYPNPAKEALTVSFNTDKPSAVKIQVVDLTGRIVWEDEAEKISEYNKTIDVRNFGKGMHIIRVMSDEMIRTNKVIIE